LIKDHEAKMLHWEANTTDSICRKLTGRATSWAARPWYWTGRTWWTEERRRRRI